VRHGGRDRLVEQADNQLSRRSDLRVPVVLTACLAAAAVVRFWNIGARPLWTDEALSVLYATIDWSEVIELRRAGTNPPLYHFLLSWWVQCFGTTAGALRSLSALCGVGAVGLMFPLARRLVGRGAALAATGLLAVSAFSIAYAQEARFYGLLQLVSIAAVLLVVRLIDRPGRREAVAAAGLLSVLVWVHTYGWFVWAACVLWVVVAVRATPAEGGRRARLARWAAGSLVVPVVAFLPWLPVLRDQVAGVLSGYWIAEPSWPHLLTCAHRLLVPDWWLRWPLALLAAALGLAWSVRFVRHARPGSAHGDSRKPPDARRLRRCHACGLAAWALLPLLVPFVWSKVGTPVFQLKYAIVAQAPLVLLFAAAAVRWPLVGVVVLALLVGVRPLGPKRDLVLEDWPGAARVLLRHHQADDPVFVHRDLTFFALDYYLQGRLPVRPVIKEGATTSAFDPYFPAGAVTHDDLLLHIRQAPERHVWLVLRREARSGQHSLLQRAAACRHVEGHWPLTAVDVFCLGARRTPASSRSQEAALLRPANHEVGGEQEGVSGGRAGQAEEVIPGAGDVAVRHPVGVFQAAGCFEPGADSSAGDGVAVAQHRGQLLPHGGIRVAQGVDGGQGGFPQFQVPAQCLAHLVFRAGVVQDIVGDLEGDPHICAEALPGRNLVR